jgi:hypothetical protein
MRKRVRLLPRVASRTNGSLISDVIRRRLPCVYDFELDFSPAPDRDFLGPKGNHRQVCPNLGLSYSLGYSDSILGSLISLASEIQCTQKKHSSKRNKVNREGGVARHPLISLIHGLRGGAYSLLGEKIVLLALVGYLFAAMAGRGAFIVFDDKNRERDRQRLGWALLLGGITIAGLCLLLSLPYCCNG